jgi:hypothetical protein
MIHSWICRCQEQRGASGESGLCSLPLDVSPSTFSYYLPLWLLGIPSTWLY